MKSLKSLGVLAFLLIAGVSHAQDNSIGSVTPVLLRFNGTPTGLCEIASQFAINIVNQAYYTCNVVTHKWEQNLAVKPQTSDAIQFVSTNGDDSNDGSSRGTAKLTIAGAYNALPATGGIILVAGGSYSISTPLVFGTAGKCPIIQGAGEYATQLVWNGSTSATVITFNCLQFSSGAGTIKGFGLQNLTIKNGVAAGTTIGLLRGGTNGAAGWYGENITVSGFNVNLQEANNAWNMECVSCNFDLPGTSDYVIPSGLTNSGESIGFVNSQFVNSVSGASAYKTSCIHNSLGDLLTFKSGSFDNCQFVQDAGTGDTVIEGVNLEDPLATGNTNSYVVVSSGTVEIHGGTLLQDAATGSVPTAFLSVSAGTLTTFGVWASNANATTIARVALSGSGNIGIFGVPKNGGNIGVNITGSSTGISMIADLNTGNILLPGILELSNINCLRYDHAGTTSLCPQSLGGGGFTLTVPAATGTLDYLVTSGTATMTTAAITAGNCGTTVTVAAAGVLATDTIQWSFNAAPAGSNAGLVAWPTAGNVNFAYCPNSAETPAAATINWKVMR